jgi:hypothetical protein
MFSDCTVERIKAAIQTLIDQVMNASLIALVGGAFAAALAVGASLSADTQAAMPTSESRSLLDQPGFRVGRHEPRLPRLFSTVNAQVGQSRG